MHGARTELADQPLAARIRELRRRCAGPRGKSAFAARLGVTVAEYDRLERGTPPSPDLLARLCGIAGADLHWLLTGSAERAPDSAAPPVHPDLLDRVARLLDQRPEVAGAVESFVGLLDSGAAASARPARRAPSGNGGQLIPIVPAADLPLEIPAGGLTVETPRALPDPAAAGAAQTPLQLAEPALVHTVGLGTPATLLVSRTGSDRREHIHAPEASDCFPGLFGVPIDDDSMAPMFAQGDFALVSASVLASMGKPALCRVTDTPRAVCRMWLGADEHRAYLGRLSDGWAEEYARTRLHWALEVLFCARRPAGTEPGVAATCSA